MTISLTESISIDQYETLTALSAHDWERDFALPYPMKYNLLIIPELTKVNNLSPIYLLFRQGPDSAEAARANLYVVDTDLSRMNSKLDARHRETIKRWYPDFLKIKVLECGHFVYLGDGFIIHERGSVERLLPCLVERMEEIGRARDVDFYIIRDVGLGHYESYLRVLKPLGYCPVLGFPNSVIPIRWHSFDAYLADLTAKARHEVRRMLRIHEQYEIEYRFIKNHREYASTFARLWRNTHAKAKAYTREVLTENFFSLFERWAPDNCEALVAVYDNRIIAFVLCLFDERMYSALDWGVDYSFVHYHRANLTRTTILHTLKRAIERKSDVLELGITNYIPKLQMGASIVPYVYFIKHSKRPTYSRALVDLLSSNINQPNNTKHSPFKEGKQGERVSLESLKIEIKKEALGIDGTKFFSKCARFNDHNVVRFSGLYNLYPEFNSVQSSSITMENGRKVVLLGTNSYLGAAYFPEVIDAARRALEKYGTGCSGSPVLNGTLDIHVELERALTSFLQREAVVLCSTGFQTNLAGLSALCEPGDIVIMDERCHRSLFDGVRLSGASYYVYKHNDMAHLQRILACSGEKRKLIVTDSVFSMEGTIADLRSICGLAKEYNAAVFVDEAHAVGVFGKNGRGMCERLGVEADVDLIMGTFSKSFASVGGFIAGRFETIDYIKHKGSAHIFSASLPPPAVAAVLAVLKIINGQPEMREGILKRAEYMAEKLHALGYDARFSGTQIVPIVFGDSTLAMAASKKFLECGVYVNPIVPSVVPEEHSGFRTSYMANHKWEDLNSALEVFRRLRPDFAFSHFDSKEK